MEVEAREDTRGSPSSDTLHIFLQGSFDGRVEVCAPQITTCFPFQQNYHLWLSDDEASPVVGVELNVNEGKRRAFRVTPKYLSVLFGRGVPYLLKQLWSLLAMLCSSGFGK